jgi:recombination protein RecA
LVIKSGAWYAYKEEKIGQGREAAKQYLKDHPELMKHLDQEIRKLAQAA